MDALLFKIILIAKLKDFGQLNGTCRSFLKLTFSISLLKEKARLFDRVSINFVT